MKKLITILSGLFFMFTSHVFGQDLATIHGKIYDEKNSQAIAFANVSVYNQKDSTLTGGAITNETGEFEIKGIKSGIYYLKLSYMGYQDKKLDKIEVTGSSKIDVGEIKLSPVEIALSEVNVVADKIKGQEKVDRTVYAIPSNIKAVSNSGLDVLKHVPSVSVDLQENISLEGRSDIAFYVDGIQRDKNFVSQLNPASIDRVEIMTNPSSKYGADISGVIQIYLIKEKAYGISGNITGAIPSPPTYIMSPGANLDYGFSNIRFYAGDRMHFEKFNSFQEINTIRTISEQNYQQLKTGKGNLSSVNNDFNYGMDWFVNNKNSLNFFGNISYNNSKFYNFKFNSQQLIDDVLMSKEKIDQDYKNKGRSNYYSLFYKRIFENPDKELKMQAGYYDYSGQDYQYFLHHQQDLATDEITNEYSREEIVNNKRKSVEYKIDYSQTFKKSSLETGATSYYQWFDNVQPIASDADNHFVYNELRMAAYVNYTYKFEKMSIQSGLRSEWSETDIDNSANNNYIALLPQLSIIKQLNKSQNLKLTIRRRIYRPGIDDLNPFAVWSDSLHVKLGNPNLNPAYSNDFELGYSKNFNSSMVSPKIYAKYKTGDFQSVSFINNDDVIESVTQNIGKTWEYGFAVNYALKLTKWWMVNGYAKVYNKVIYNNEGANDLKNEKISFQTDFTSIMTFFKTWNFMMMMNYRSPYISYQQTNYRDMLFLVAVEKEIFKNGKLQIMYLPPYTKKFTFQRYEYKSNELFNSWKGGLDFDYLFAIEFSYSFRTGKKVKSLQRSTDIDSDTNKSLF
jgi:hypothetical protein